MYALLPALPLVLFVFSASDAGSRRAADASAFSDVLPPSAFVSVAPFRPSAGIRRRRRGGRPRRPSDAAAATAARRAKVGGSAAAAGGGGAATSNVDGTDRERSSRAPRSIRTVPTVDASIFDPDEHYHRRTAPILLLPSRRRRDDGVFPVPYETPVLIRNVLSPSECEATTDAVAEALGDVAVDVQRKVRTGDDGETETTEICECELRKAFDLMMTSSHDASVFAFCEGLLDDDNDDEDGDPSGGKLRGLREALRSKRERLFGGSSADWFESFPPGARPTDCVVLAGEGASSTLHRDPFEWTGTSLCLEGTKVWRFVCPPVAKAATDGVADGSESDFDWDIIGDDVEKSGVRVVDDALEWYRLPSAAWNDGGGGGVAAPSAGWQSDRSLYAVRHPSVPSARALSEMGPDERSDVLRSVASDASSLAPDARTREALERRGLELWTAVQGPGDLFVIPAHWWHQTYGLEPSLSVASQRCGRERDAARVVRHVLETASRGEESGGDDDDVPELLSKGRYDEDDDPKEVVRELFKHLSKIEGRRRKEQ